MDRQGKAGVIVESTSITINIVDFTKDKWTPAYDVNVYVDGQPITGGKGVFVVKDGNVTDAWDKASMFKKQLIRDIVRKTTTASVGKQRQASNLVRLLMSTPATNSVWSVNGDKNMMIAEMSDLSHGGTLDPWGQPLNRTRFHAERDREGEVTHWTGTTSINGQVVQLMIFND